jgi:pentatricopeptide repeat protein
VADKEELGVVTKTLEVARRRMVDFTLSDTAAHLVAAYARAGAVGDVVPLLERGVDLRFYPLPRHWERVIAAHLEAGDLDAAIDTFHRMRRYSARADHACRPRQRTVLPILDTLAAAGRAEDAAKLSDVAKRVVLDFVAAAEPQTQRA